MRLRLSHSDAQRLLKTEHTRSLNFRILNYYSNYLNFNSDYVTSEMVVSLKNDCGVTDEEAVAAILSAAFSLDGGADDTTLTRKYIARSVKKMDAAFYRNDPYYKNIIISDMKSGAWELRHETYKPYEGFIYDDLMLERDFTEIPGLGFFDEEFTFPAVLEDGREWMQVTPNEVETLRGAVGSARGKVLTYGLGLGYFAYMASQKAEVSSVTVVEKDDNVIRLFDEYILPQFPHKEKVSVISTDAFDYADNVMAFENYDFCLADTWHDAGDGFDMYLKFKRAQRKTPCTEWSYWIEDSLLSRLRWLVFSNIFAAYKAGGVSDSGDGTITSYDEIRDMLTNESLRELAPDVTAVSR